MRTLIGGGIGSGPIRQVASAVEVEILGGASADLDPRRCRRWKAVDVIGLVFPRLRAVAVGVGGAAVVPITDLIGEGDVVAMRGPRCARMRSGGRKHRME